MDFVPTPDSGMFEFARYNFIRSEHGLPCRPKLAKKKEQQAHVQAEIERIKVGILDCLLDRSARRLIAGLVLHDLTFPRECEGCPLSA